MKRFLNITGAVSGVAGGFFLLGFFLILQASLLFSALIGLAGFTGTYLLMYAFRPKNEISFNINNTVAPEELNRILKETEEKLKMLQPYLSQIRNTQVKDRVGQLVLDVKDMLTSIKKDPKNIKHVKQFLSYYLNTTTIIVKKYTELSSQNVRTPEIQGTLQKAEDMLGSIEDAFNQQKTRLLQDDIMELDVEIGTLEKTLIAEGLK